MIAHSNNLSSLLPRAFFLPRAIPTAHARMGNFPALGKCRGKILGRSDIDTSSEHAWAIQMLCYDFSDKNRKVPYRSGLIRDKRCMWASCTIHQGGLDQGDIGQGGSFYRFDDTCFVYRAYHA